MSLVAKLRSNGGKKSKPKAQTTETKENFNETDSATGAKVETSKEETTTVKPPQRGGDTEGVNEPALGDASEPGTEKPVDDDQK